MKPFRSLLGGMLFLIAATVPTLAQLNPYAASFRFYRGTSGYQDVHSFVIPLDGQKGVGLTNTGNNADYFEGVAPWFSRTARASQTNYHLDYLETLYQNDGFYHIFKCQNPIVAFGVGIGGSPLYTNETYRFGIHFGAPFESTDSGDAIYASPIRILVYPRSAFDGATNNIAATATNYITIPRRFVAADSTAWINFITNNTGLVHNGHGLRTEVRLVDGPMPYSYYDAWGAKEPGVNVQSDAFILSHSALPDSKE